MGQPAAVRRLRGSPFLATCRGAGLACTPVRHLMATIEPHAPSIPPLAHEPIEGPRGWKRRLEDPFNTYYRYPIALAIVRLLVRTPITPNQISLVQPFFAACAGWLLTFDDWRYHLGAVAL